MPVEEKDIWRKSILRYAGYANEVGESFRPIFPQFVIPSYIVAFAYVLGDTQDKARKASSSEKYIQAFDTLIWQTLASVIMPGFTINRVVHVAKKYIKYPTPQLQIWGPTFIGLATIPIIIHPIDNAVDYLFDSTLRPYFFKDKKR